MLGIIGKKLGMTQIFNEQGQQIPCTVVEAKPNPVGQVLEDEYDKSGYRAVQLGYGSQRLRRESKKGERDPRGRRASKAEVGHAAKAGLSAPPRVLRAFRLDDAPKGTDVPTYKAGDTNLATIFTVGEYVEVTGSKKGRVFQGGVMVHGVGGGASGSSLS